MISGTSAGRFKDWELKWVERARTHVCRFMLALGWDLASGFSFPVWPGLPYKMVAGSQGWWFWQTENEKKAVLLFVIQAWKSGSITSATFCSSCGHKVPFTFNGEENRVPSLSGEWKNTRDQKYHCGHIWKTHLPEPFNDLLLLYEHLQYYRGPGTVLSGLLPHNAGLSCSDQH